MRRQIRMFALFIWAVLLCVGVEHRATAEPQPTPQAHVDRGRALFQKGDLNGAIAEYRAALRVEPNDAVAHYLLGAALGQNNDADGEIAEYRAALRINDRIPDVHFYLGMALRRYFCAYLYLLPMGRFEEAVVEMKRALETDPLSLIINANLGDTYYYARQYDQAIAQGLKTLEIAPEFGVAHYNLRRAYEQQGMYEQAMTQKKAFGEMWQRRASLLEKAHRASGAQGYWQKSLELDLDDAKRAYILPTFIAKDYTRLSDKEKAFQWLEKAYADRDGDLIYLRVEPMYDPLRSDPRYADLVRRIGLPP